MQLASLQLIHAVEFTGIPYLFTITRGIEYEWRIGEIFSSGANRCRHGRQAAEKLAHDEQADLICTPVGLANQDSLKESAARAEQLHGHVDIFIGNAALLSTHLVDALDEDIMDQILETNLTFCSGDETARLGENYLYLVCRCTKIRKLRCWSLFRHQGRIGRLPPHCLG